MTVAIILLALAILPALYIAANWAPELGDAPDGDQHSRGGISQGAGNERGEKK